MKTLLIINDPPCGTERAYSAMRLAIALLKREGEEMGDAAACARCGQKLLQGYYKLERMLKIIHGRGGDIGVCSSCMDASGLADDDLVEGSHRCSMEELTDWTIWADRVLAF